MKFPKDNDGEILKALFDEGLDFSKPHKVDFAIGMEEESQVKQLKDIISTKGFEVEVEYDDEEDEWLLYCTKVMKLEHKAIVDTQAMLDTLSAPFDTCCDGWGVLEEE